MVQLKSTNALKIRESLMQDADMVCYAKESDRKPYVMCTSCNGFDKSCASYVSKKFHNRIRNGPGDNLLNL